MNLQSSYLAVTMAIGGVEALQKNYTTMRMPLKRDPRSLLSHCIAGAAILT